MRLYESRLQRLLAIIPKGLHRQIKAGPADEDNWTILVASPAVAAKVRQILPTLTAAVAQQEQRTVLIRVKVTLNCQKEFGADCLTRTDDLRFTRPLLYQLS